MGYYTYFTLSTNATDDKEREIALWMIDNLDYFSFCSKEMVSKSYEPLTHIVGSDSMKWYDHEDDMRKVAAAFPDVKFELYGEGEDRDDTWREFYWGDKFDSDTAQIVWGPVPRWMGDNYED